MSFKPGDIVKDSGIYRCKTCGHRCTSVKGERFPPHDHRCKNKRYILVQKTHK